MTDKNEQQSAESTPFSPAQNMSLAIFKMYQDYWKQQQQATLQYWTEIIKSTYNPWK
jgi:hypothetical protein